MMKNWTRWQSWVALIAGVYTLLSPIWTTTDTTASWTMVVLGVVIAVAALWSMSSPEDRSADYALVILGVLLFISPWVMGFETMDGLALTAWIAGVVTALSGVLAVPQIEQRMHHHSVTH